jgi:serine/threonine protein kinase
MKDAPPEPDPGYTTYTMGPQVDRSRAPESRRGSSPVESLGDFCVRRGYATETQVRECLELQREFERLGRPAPRLGELMVQRGYLSPEQVVEALSGQRQEIRFCPSCRIHVNVFIRPDAVTYTCARCRTALVAPESASALAAEEDVPGILTQEALPPEVERARSHPESIFGKYVLVRELGRGGAGVIYLAWDSYLSQYVALKLLRPEEENAGETSLRTRQLMREARNTIRLRHPGIVTVYDVGRVGRDFYISMEFLEGRTLEDRIEAARAQGRRSPYFADAPGTLRLLAEAARAVHYAHTRPDPIIHCDLKPANILIDAEGRPHVLDFGLARNLRIEKSANGEITGTPSYMSPEQACGIADQIDHRTDVYSLGAILYELLSGRPTFVGETISILEKTVSVSPEPPSEVLKLPSDAFTRPHVAVPPFLEELCMRCLDKDPARRPRTAAEVADLLEQAARHLDAARKPPSKPPPATVIVRPAEAPPRRLARPAAALAAAAGVAALVIWANLPKPQAVRPGDLIEEVRSRIALFQGARALDLARSIEGPSRDPAVAEAEAVAGLCDAVARAVAERQPRFDTFRLRERGVRDAVAVRAGPEGIVLKAGSREQTAGWRDVEPSQVLELARVLDLENSPVLRRALAVYALHSGRPSDAKTYFDSLRTDDAAR